MKRISVFKLYLVILSIPFITSCINDVDLTDFSGDIKIDQSLVVPVGEATLTLDDVLNQLTDVNFIGANETEIYVQAADSLTWNFSDISFMGNTTPLVQSVYLSPLGTVPFPPNTKDSISTDLSLYMGFNTNPTQQRVDIIKANSGTMSFTIDKTDVDLQPSDVKVRLTFPSSVFSFATGSNIIEASPVAFGVPFDLNLGAFSMYTYNNANSLPVNLKIYFKSGNSVVMLSPTSKVDVSFSFKGIDPKVIYGHFNPTISDLAQEKIVELPDLNAIIPHGLLRLAEPELKFTIENSIGIKLGLNLEYLKGYMKNDPAYTPVYAKFKNNNTATQIIINAAPEYGTVGNTVYTMNKDSGQLDGLFNNSPIPDMLAYKFNITNVRTEAIDFISPGAGLKAKFNIKVPLHLKSGSYYELRDTISNLNLDSILSDGTIQKAILQLKVTNGLPVAAKFTLKLLADDDSEISTTIEPEYTINAPAVDANGFVITSQLSSQKIQLEILKSQLASLKVTKKIAYTVRIESAPDKPINLQKTNSFGVKVGLFVQGDKTINIFNK